MTAGSGIPASRLNRFRTRRAETVVSKEPCMLGVWDITFPAIHANPEHHRDPAGTGTVWGLGLSGCPEPDRRRTNQVESATCVRRVARRNGRSVDSGHSETSLGKARRFSGSSACSSAPPLVRVSNTDRSVSSPTGFLAGDLGSPPLVLWIWVVGSLTPSSNCLLFQIGRQSSKLWRSGASILRCAR